MPNTWRGRGMRRRVSEAAESGPVAEAPGSEGRDPAHPCVGQQDPRVPSHGDPCVPRSLQEVIDSQERRARDTARALIRSQDVSGTAAMPDVSWPPRGRATLVMDRRHTGHHRVRGGRGGLPGCPSPVAYCVLTLVTA